MHNFPPLILASSSPRRQELLRMANYDFTVETPLCAEDSDAVSPAETVLSLAERKAKCVAAQHTSSRCWVLGADTLVALGDEILGKPETPEVAASMLARLQGKSHSVYTGICLVDSASGDPFSHCEHTLVHVSSMTSEEIARYVASGDPLDKAGAYGIQGAFASYISRIEGDYYNVVGLPLHGLRVLWNEAIRCWME